MLALGPVPGSDEITMRCGWSLLHMVPAYVVNLFLTLWTSMYDRDPGVCLIVPGLRSMSVEADMLLAVTPCA